MKRKYRVTIGTKTFTVEVEEAEDGTISVMPVSPIPAATVQAKSEEKNKEAESSAGGTTIGGTAIKAPMNGIVRSIRCRVDDVVKAHDVLLTLEAMKMENEIYASKPGVVRKILVAEGQAVEQDDVMLTIDEREIA
jgi:biotin carboxyl carrier protein